MPIPAFLVQLAIAIVLQVVALVLTPKPKGPRPDAVKDLDSPTAEAGRPMPRLFGTATIKSPNVIWYGEKGTRTYETRA